VAIDAENSHVRLTVPAKPEYVLLGRLALSGVGRLSALDPGEVDDFKLAVTEAATAFVGNGSLNGCEPGTRLSFDFSLGENTLSAEVSCPGGPNLTEEEQSLGQAIIDATVDTVERDELTIRLTKHAG